LGIPTIPQQVAIFTQSSPDLGGRPVASLLGGANDLFFGGIGSPNVAAVARRAANAVADSALSLRDAGVKDVLLWTLPDLGLTPAYNLFLPELQEDATRGSVVFNATLRRRVADLRRAGLNVEQVDLFRFFNQLVENPEGFGVSDATLPCVFPSAAAAAAFGQGSQVCSGDLVFERAFWSEVHPNSVIHAGIAELVRDKITPVPLPLPAFLLLGGLSALIMAGRRRRI
jgi:outer membrane lipase/esterase